MRISDWISDVCSSDPPIEAATDVSIMTRAGVERILRFAFRLAQSRPRKLLTVITKSNAQRHAMVMWDEIAKQVSAEFPDVNWDKELRSEEHTSELQSLMRISYAVFCLKKKHTH